MKFDPYEVTLATLGVVALVTAVIPAALHRRPISLPMVLVALGALVFAVVPALRAPDPTANLELTEKLTEMGVLVSLMAAGLAIDRPPGWRSWAPTWRLLAVTMPLGIAATAALGVGLLGLPLGAALLLGAVLAPTDPVVSEELTVEGPQEAGGRDGEDDVRATLTSEAGLNDALAFPFVYLAVVVSEGATVGSLLEWLALDVVVRLSVGVAVGVACGQLAQWLAFGFPARPLRLSETGEGFVAVAIVLLSYGLAELLYGYGFLAVFVAALTFRRAERSHEYHRVLHSFTEQVERVAVIGLLVLFGGSLVGGILDGVSPATVAVGLLMVLLVRPLAGVIGLAGRSAGVGHRSRILVSSYGVRGIGSIYYLAYGLRETDFADPATLWATVACTILASVVIHGATVTYAQRLVR